MTVRLSLKFPNYGEPMTDKIEALAEKISTEIETDLNDRSGLELDSLDDEIRGEILAAWHKIVESSIRDHLAGMAGVELKTTFGERSMMILGKPNTFMSAMSSDIDTLTTALAAARARIAELEAERDYYKGQFLRREHS